MKTGYIEITDKVRFVYHELKKPKIICWCDSCFSYNHKELSKYEASKRTVEVSNVKHYHPNSAFEYWRFNMETIKDGQKYKAEVNGTAEIIELL